MNLSSIVAAPFELVVATVFLYQLLGWTAIAGLSVMAIALPLNNILVRRRIRIHRSVLASRDRRMEVLNEFIQGKYSVGFLLRFKSDPFAALQLSDSSSTPPRRGHGLQKSSRPARASLHGFSRLA